MMAIRKAALSTLLAFGLLPGFPGCKKSPTETSPPIAEPTIALLCSPSTAKPDEIVSASVYIKGNLKEIRVFGLDMTFDAEMFRFQEVRRGTLTGAWAEVDGNEVGPGNLRVGGFLGGAAAIPVKSEGTLAEIRLKVTGTKYSNGQQSQICIKQYTDALAEFKPSSVCSTFTLKK